MLNWSWPEERTDLQIDRVILTDLDISRKLDGARTLNGTYGNCMWRSPEGLLDEGVGKHSEVFSFGLLVSQITFLLFDQGILYSRIVSSASLL